MKVVTRVLIFLVWHAFLVLVLGCGTQRVQTSQSSMAQAQAVSPGRAPAQAPAAAAATAANENRPTGESGPAGSAMSDGESANSIVSEDDEASDTPVVHEAIEGDQNLTASRPWRAPDYSNQAQALGWSESAFAVPKGLETNVAFWVDIYSKYTTDQGVLHDSEYIDLIYEVLDFTHISARADMNLYKKEHLRQKMVKDAKKRIATMLTKFETLKDPGELSDNEKKIWNYFNDKIQGKKKFKEAASKSRLRFQLGQRDRIVQGIFFSGRYLEEFEGIFKEAGLPLELTRMVFVESSFNVMARSKVGASGLWQIMRYTAKPYKMINDAFDNRNHPTQATRLAAKLLRHNYQMLEAWPLAVTGYNHGPTGVLKLTKIHKTRELGEMAQATDKKKRLGFASRNFYASFMAILEVEKNAPKYFGTVQWSAPLNAVNISLTKPLKYADLLKWFDDDDHKAQIFNPQINSPVRKGKMALPKGAIVSIPQSKEVAFVEAHGGVKK